MTDDINTELRTWITPIVVDAILLPYLPFHEQWPFISQQEQRCKQQLQQAVETKLEDLLGSETWLKEVKPTFVKSKALVAGSFTLDAALGTDFANDLDIFVPVAEEDVEASKQKNENLITPLEACIYNLCYQGNKGWLKMASYEAANRYGHLLGSRVNWVRTYKSTFPHLGHKQPVIQVIQVVVSSSLVEWVQQMFDFDCCKITYDGNAVDFVSLANLTDVMARKTRLKWTTRTKSSIERYKKYRERGITFDIPEPQALFHNLCRDYMTHKLDDQLDIVPVAVVTPHMSLAWKDSSSWITLQATEEVASRCNLFDVWNVDDIQSVLIKDNNRNRDRNRKRKLGQPIFEFQINLSSSRSKGDCSGPDCLFFLCGHPHHLHFRGKHLGHGATRDMVFVVVETLD
jgi:hypothetical protein